MAANRSDRSDRLQLGRNGDQTVCAEKFLKTFQCTKVFSGNKVLCKSCTRLCSQLFCGAMDAILSKERSFAHLKIPQICWCISKCLAASVSAAEQWNPLSGYFNFGTAKLAVRHSRAAMLILSIKFNSPDYFSSIRPIRNVCDSNV